MSTRRHMARLVVALARRAPELVPALLWLVAVSGRSSTIRRLRREAPPLEELAALSVLVGDAVHEMLGASQRGREMRRSVAEASTGSSLLEIRARAAQRHGLGIETLV